MKKPSYVSLLRLALANQNSIYRQNWYYDEDFASKTMDEYTIAAVDLKSAIEYDHRRPAVVWVWHFLNNQVPIRMLGLSNKWVWTSDVDDEGQPVYVGCYAKKGFQVHRLLHTDPKLFINSLVLI